MPAEGGIRLVALDLEMSIASSQVLTELEGPVAVPTPQGGRLRLVWCLRKGQTLFWQTAFSLPPQETLLEGGRAWGALGLGDKMRLNSTRSLWER